MSSESETSHPAGDGGASAPAAKLSTAPAKKQRWQAVFFSLVLVVAGVLTGFYYVKYEAPYESTDDAYIEAHVTSVAPQVAGRVEQVLVQDNQAVRPGDTLVQIDPRDYQVKLDQARANLAVAKSQQAQANAQLTVDQAKVGQEQASLRVVQAEAKRAGADLKRYQAVSGLGVSQSQLDAADTQASASTASVEVARNRELAMEALVSLDQATIQSAAAEVQRNEAAVEQAELYLSYTQVKAAQAGVVTHRTVEAGAYVQPGQALLAVVPREVWVVANFKETQLTHMRPGQPVTLTVDAYPQARLTGRVDSIQSGSGAHFSLLPPENASGNFVKVVQRVPVKIVLDNTVADGLVLGPGMSVEPKVKIQ